MLGLEILSPATRYKLLAYISKQKIHCLFIKGKRRKNTYELSVYGWGDRHKEI